ncbi:MAG TPA: type IV pilus twitching motility protein PilT [Vicinamibacterales bacterium]|nr:type IV pilus twitching motility protein PilT [Vicinamibacterales bacterium]
MPTLPELLKTTVELDGSDLHLSIESPPQVRVHGELRRLDFPDLSASDTKALAYSVLTDAQKKRFEESLELDFSFGIRGIARFRCNLFNQKGAVGAVYRQIPERIKTFDELHLPAVVAKLAEKPRGLVLVTGPTGSGKSTTLAAMIDKINTENHGHILTIEDPIEYLHQHKKCLVNQREIHADTNSFTNALRAALREDPDVVLIGEMRDLETVESALRIAETGHLTFGTLHTNSAVQTINRIIDVFPSHQQSQIRTQLSLVLEGVVCQALLPKANGGGRVVSLEVLIPTPAVRNLIREDKIHQIYSSMQTGQEKVGMQTMNQSLTSLYMKRQISLETALSASSNREELQEMINRGAGVVAGAGLGRPGGTTAGIRPVQR